METFKLDKSFFQREDTHKIAKDLLGKVLIRIQNDRIQAGKIVEVESYHGFEDRASHASKSRTKRNEVMFKEGGHYYVYLIYGMYWNLNIVTGKKEFPSAILIRALEPIYDSQIELDKLSSKDKFLLSSGPGKLCRWMNIDKGFYGKSVKDKKLFIIEAENLYSVIPANAGIHVSNRFLNKSGMTILEAKRIGVDYAGEWADKNWRLYLKNNEYVSKK